MANKTHNSFEQTVRKKLQNFEATPPDSIWEDINAQIPAAIVSKRKTYFKWAAAVITLLLLGGLSYHYMSKESKDVGEKNTINTEKVGKQVDISSEIPSKEIDQFDFSSTENNKSQEASSQNKQEVNQSLYSETAPVIIPETDALHSIEVPIEEQTNTKSLLLKKEANSRMAKDATFVEPLLFSAFNEPKAEMIIPNRSARSNLSKAGYDFFDDDAIDEITKGHNIYKRWELGIEFSPEWISIPNNDNNIRNYGIDFSARYHFSNWFVESGLGVSLSKDDGVYKVDTIAEYKGSYLDVYDVSFDISGEEPIPIFHTNMKNVYENIDTNYVSRTKNDYVYLSIPLNFGYSHELSEKFSIYFKTGLLASFKIYENIPEFDNGATSSNDIIYSEAKYFNRSPWHMQAQINVGLHYFLSKKIAFSIEPNARYYLKSLVENNPGGNPYGFGAKFGFKYIITK